MSRQDKNNRPPNWAIKFLCWFCSDRLIEGVLGDLLEQHEEDLVQKGPRKANWIFVLRVFRLLHPAIVSKDFKVAEVSVLALAKNHLVVAFRSMKKYKFYAITNLFGMALAVSFVFLCYLFIQKERSFDHFHTKKDRTYRLFGYKIDPATGATIDGSLNGCTPIPLAPDLAAGFTGIAHYSRLGSTSGTVVKDNVPYTEVIAMADPDFFSMFDFPVLHGNPEALTDPLAILLSEQRSKKYYGLENPIGQSLHLTLGDTSIVFRVAGVIDNKQNISSLKFDFLVPFEQLRRTTSAEAFQSYDISFIESYITFGEPQSGETGALLSSILEDQLNTSSGRGMIGLQPLTDIHFNSNIQGMYPAANSIKVWVLGGLALLVLVIALVNFIMLSLGHSMHRMKEIGLRKMLGARKGNIRVQLVIESFAIACISSGLSILLTIYFLPSFNELIGGGIDYDIVASHLLFMVLLLFFVSGIAGGVQALALARLAPIQALRGKLILKKESRFKEGAIIFQFSISVLLVYAALVINDQMKFVQDRDLGFDQEQLIEMELHTANDRETTQRMIEKLNRDLGQNPMILRSSAVMNGFKDPWTKLSFRQVDQSDLELHFNLVDQAYIETMNMAMVSGHSFAQEDSHLPTDIIVNESLVKMMNWENAIGKQIPGQNFRVKHRIVGVVKDFHFGSLHSKIEPLILVNDPRAIQSGITGLTTYVWPPNWYSLVIRLGPGDWVDTIDHIERTWSEINPGKEFTFRFVDDLLASKYAEEIRWRKVFRLASVFAISIAWLGLLALTRLALQRRTKEIGIRKILGASVFGIIKKLSTGYLTLIVWACVLVAPLGWWMMDNWLASFTYRIDLSPVTFVLSSLVVLLVTMASVVLQSYRAGSANPVNSLRSE